MERYGNSLQLCCFEFFVIPYHLFGEGILVTTHLLKDALLLKRLPRTNRKELGKNKNIKIVDNFNIFSMVHCLPDFELPEKRCNTPVLTPWYLIAYYVNIVLNHGLELKVKAPPWV